MHIHRSMIFSTANQAALDSSLSDRLFHTYVPHIPPPPPRSSPPDQVEGSDFGVLLRSQQAASEAAAAAGSGIAPALSRLSAEDLALLQSGPRLVSDETCFFRN